MSAMTGLDQMAMAGFGPFHGKNLAIVCNQASVTNDFQHLLEVIRPFQAAGKLKISSIMGPQHGLWGQTQDNMIEWEGGYPDAITGAPVHSLYGENRTPTEIMLKDVDHLVFDVPDVGARYYTFIWTLANCIEACSKLGIPVTVLDRPNPIGGIDVEGPVMDPEYKSFVGLFPLPARHGMTAGEVGQYLVNQHYPEAKYDVIKILRWDRSQHIHEAEVAWAMPSPNMPTYDTALVYPGQCLLEGTKLNEGRGTTRPFEIFGAPYIDPIEYAKQLNGMHLPGVHFRPYSYQPTFHKYGGENCNGVHIHVLDAGSYKPVMTTISILHKIREMYGEKFCWQDPPYEYEYEKLPIDILAGNTWLRKAIDSGENLATIAERMQSEVDAFMPIRAEALLYGGF